MRTASQMNEASHIYPGREVIHAGNSNYNILPSRIINRNTQRNGMYKKVFS